MNPSRSRFTPTLPAVSSPPAVSSLPAVASLLAIAFLLAATSLTALAPSAKATPPPPAELEVVEGSGWLREARFGLRWRNPSTGGQPVAAAHYLLRSSLGSVIAGPKRIEFAARGAAGIAIAAGPGTYTAEVWLEDALGSQGPAASTKVRFDDTRPGTVAPLPDPGWIGRAELPLRIRVSRPAVPLPLAGIRGYAVSVASREDREPCAGQVACSDAETNLRGGFEDTTLTIGELPNGVSHVRAVAVSGSGMRSAISGHAILRVDRDDPVTRLAGVPGGWVNHAVALRATATDKDSGMGPNAGAFTAIRVDQAPPAVAAGETTGVAIVDEGAHSVAYYARDAAGNVNDGKVSNGQRNPDPGRVAVRIDRGQPRAFLVGSIGPRDPETIEARVADDLSGPSSNRGSIAVRALGSSDGFSPLPTSAAGGALRAHWPSDQYPRGDYEFRVTAFDAAGNSAATTRKANGTALVLPAPLKVPARLEASMRGRREIVLGERQAVTIEGTLALGSGDAARGATIEVIERFDPGASHAQRRSVALTDSGGRFRLRLPPGASRDVLVRFDGSRWATRASAGELRIGVRPAVGLRASSSVAKVGGRPLSFSGRVGSGGERMPADGLVVRLQFRLPGGRWREFRTLRSDRRGRFRYRYAFSDDDSRGARFEFRAVAPTQSDWPFEPGGSRPVAVRGA